MSVSSVNRVTGLASGIDTDATVKSLMTAEKIPLNKLYQKKQLAEWKRDDYRSITNTLRELKDTYFNTLKSATNMLSSNPYKKFTSTSSDSTVVTASGNADSLAGTHSIIVNSIATKGTDKSSAAITKDVVGSSLASVSTVAGKEFSLEVDGLKKTITISSSVTTVAELKTDLQAAIDTAFGADKIVVSDTSAGNDGTGNLQFATKASSGVTKITLSEGTTAASGVLVGLGFASSSSISNRISTSDSLSTISSKLKTAFTFNSDNELDLSINGVDFQFTKDTSLSSMMSTINSSSSANVTMQYNEVDDTIEFLEKQTGAGKTMQLNETDSTFFTAVNYTADASGDYSGAYTAGTDAKVTLDGQEITRSNNSFSVSGVTYTILKQSALVTGGAADEREAETITLSQDTESIYTNINSFVEKYNEVIATINEKLSEDYDRDYPPLTDEQKEEMTEEEITKWETVAKTGLLKGDSILQGIVTNMRKALYDGVSGISSSLASIGITTGSYEDKGKLVIDETKLKAAIESDPDGVKDLFSKKSTSVSSNTYITSEQRATRYKEEGLAYRLYDIIEDNIRTTGGKGTLLEKAGIEGDATEYNSTIYDQINDYEDSIYDLEERLDDKETAYYTKFTAMEKAISTMNSQSSWISSMLGTSSS